MEAKGRGEGGQKELAKRQTELCVTPRVQLVTQPSGRKRATCYNSDPSFVSRKPMSTSPAAAATTEDVDPLWTLSHGRGERDRWVSRDKMVEGRRRWGEESGSDVAPFLGTSRQ